jgi:transposase
MLYLSIDLHRKQMTISLRDEDGTVLLNRQVSTWGAEPVKFLEQVAQRAGSDGYLAILEVCGFHDWLAELLPQHGCREVVLIQAEKKSRRKTDRRDANQLGELLWLNRRRLQAGQAAQGLRRVVPPTPVDRDDRRLTQWRSLVTRQSTQLVNRVRSILRRLNIEQNCPTKGIQTRRARAWLEEVALGEMDRFEMDQLLAQWDQVERQRREIDAKIAERIKPRGEVATLLTVPGISQYSGLALVCRVGEIKRFPTPRSLANYWGLTPSCRNSGEATQRLGSITKDGSRLARYILGNLVLHVLRKDGRMRAWFAKLKKRRGAKIARVAVMRRLTVILWHMLSKQQPYEMNRLDRPSAPPVAAAAARSPQTKRSRSKRSAATTSS